jgi:hypothetical protein
MMADHYLDSTITDLRFVTEVVTVEPFRTLDIEGFRLCV